MHRVIEQQANEQHTVCTLSFRHQLFIGSADWCTRFLVADGCLDLWMDCSPTPLLPIAGELEDTFKFANSVVSVTLFEPGR